jgi:hypothetical protein
MSITWNGDNVINEEGFRVYRLATGTDIYLLPGAVGVDATLATDGLDRRNPLHANTSYCYIVVAYNGQGPAGIPSGARMACGRTWSQQPIVSDLQIEAPIVALPQFSWKFDDADPTPPLTEPTQTKVQMQVCDVDFGKDDDIGHSNGCPSDKLRWDSGEITKSATKLGYLENYPDGLAQHPLDFGSGSYYVRLRAWDDAGGTSSNNTSIWLVGWGENQVFCTFPKNSKAGLTHTDNGMDVLLLDVPPASRMFCAMPAPEITP